MRILRFNESKHISPYAGIKDDNVKESREWLLDFISDLEIDFPGVSAEIHDGNPWAGELDIVKLNINNKLVDWDRDKDSRYFSFKTDDDLGWSRKDFLKYIESKVKYIDSSVDGLSFYRFSINTFSRENILIKEGDLDLSSPRFYNRVKNGINRITLIKVFFEHQPI